MPQTTQASHQEECLESVVLYCTKDGSNKVYQIQLVRVPDGYETRAQNGPRHGTLTPRMITPVATTEALARKAYLSKLNSKLREGYTQDVSGVARVDSPTGETLDSGYRPHLLVDITESSPEEFLRSNAYFGQEKMDGTRAMILGNNKAIHGINKLGLVTGLPEPVVQAVRRFVQQTGGMLFLDAERIKDTFHVFDVLIAEGQDLRDAPAERRALLIEGLVERLDCPFIRAVRPFFGAEAKRALFETIRGRNGEGMVFKDVRGPYVAGLAKNGTQFKYKFYKQVTVQVIGLNKGKRSARIAMFEADGTPVEVGNVTIPLNASMPQTGDFLEVRYLYGTGKRKLFQPVYSFSRTDVTQADAAISKMVLKPEDSDEE